jgi:glycosyltransferase involved in cell wall biosynthesis
MDDVDAAASAFERLIASEDMRRRMGEAGREKVVREFDEGHPAREMIEVYEELLKDRR